MALAKRSSGMFDVWSPFREIEEVSGRIGQLFRSGALSARQEGMAPFDWSPSVSVSESDKEYVIRADLPGVARDDIKVSVESRVLSLRGERRQRLEEGDEKFHRVESVYGAFLRRFTLPDDAIEEEVKAETKDGVLEIHVPKTHERQEKARTVPVEEAR
jgi:HSP20 family protein